MIRSLCLALALLISPIGPAFAEEADPLGAIRARQLYLDGQPGLAFAMAWRLAQLGDLQAEVTLGFFYANGIGTVVDPVRAVELFRKAAAGNHPAALYNLAISYEHGRLGLPQDLKLAATLYQRAAVLDHAPSLYRLGSMYRTGKGVTRDVGLARALLDRAVVLGNPQAAEALARMLSTGAELPEDLPRARNLFLIAAAQGIGDAAFSHALMLENGQGGPVDLTGAEYWYRQAQAGGNVEAARKLAQLLTRNALPGPDRQVEALAWCLWYEAQQPLARSRDPLRSCTWALTGLDPAAVASAQALVPTF